MQSIRWRHGIVMPLRVYGVVFESSLAMRMEIGFFFAFLKNKRLPYFKKISASSKLKKVRITNVLVNFLSVRPLLQGGGVRICGGVVSGGARLYMTREGVCTTAPYAHLKGVTEQLPVVKDGVWVLMAKPSPRLPESAYFQKNLVASRAAKALGFEGLPMKQYYLQM